MKDLKLESHLFDFYMQKTWDTVGHLTFSLKLVLHIFKISPPALEREINGEFKEVFGIFRHEQRCHWKEDDVKFTLLEIIRESFKFILLEVLCNLNIFLHFFPQWTFTVKHHMLLTSAIMTGRLNNPTTDQSNFFLKNICSNNSKNCCRLRGSSCESGF